MLGADGAYQFVQWFGTGPGRFWWAVLAAAAGVAILGGVVERLLFRHLYAQEELSKLLWGTQQKSVSRPPRLAGSFTLFGTTVPYNNLFILLLGPAIALGFWFV